MKNKTSKEFLQIIHLNEFEVFQFFYYSRFKKNFLYVL
jgi:hypothetical protein